MFAAANKPCNRMKVETKLEFEFVFYGEFSWFVLVLLVYV